MRLIEIAPFPATLEDGTIVQLRPLVRSDEARVLRFFEGLSDECHRNRFWEKGGKSLPQRALDISNTDESNHFAWVALPERGDVIPGYGGASCWRDAEDPERAEIGLTVADEVQRKGIGTLLLSILWFEAWSRGIREFYGIVKNENRDLFDWFTSLGAEVKRRTRYLEISLELTSPEDCIDRIRYTIEAGASQILLADWMQDWIELSGCES
ncbi:MAG: GNAT family N-acetyltransferase [Verrucomicrobiota bacterium]